MAGARGVWGTARVVETADVATRIRRIVLAPAEPRPVSAGEHLDVRLEADGRTLTRSYSIVDATPSGDRVAVSVLRTRDSRGGSIRMHELAVGDELRASAPSQDFPLRIGARRYVLVAGGIGITPILGMAAALRRVRADYELVFAGRGRAHMAYLSELRELHGDRLRVHADDEGTALDVPALVDAIEPGTELYMCGPIRLMDAIRRAWIERGLDPTALRYETFGNSGWFDAEPFAVEIPRLGVRCDVGPDESMLEALERAGVDMLFDCRKGECGVCQIRVERVDGALDQRDVFFSDAQKRSGRNMCCCVSRAVRADGPGPARLVVDVT